MTTPSTIRFSNGVVIEPLHDGGAFLGLGSVVCDGVALRSPSRPILPDLRTPWGVRLLNPAVRAIDTNARGAHLAFDLSAVADGPMDWMLHSVRDRWPTGDWSRGPEECEATLDLVLKQVTHRIGGLAFKGFSYQYRYRSKAHPIFRLLDRATWELGGDAVGNEIWLRNGYAPSIRHFAKAGDAWCTEWYLPKLEQPNIMQFLPWQTALQGFTLTASERGLLVTRALRLAHIRSYFEKRAGDDAIAHWHEHTADLAHRFDTAPVEVLFCAGAFDRADRANACEAVARDTSDRLHAEAGFRREHATAYAVVEEWEDADLDRYRREALPALAACGVRKVGLANHCAHNMNTYGVSNMCCTLDYKIAETVGEANLKRFCDDAHAAGLQVEMWANTAISTLSIILDKRNGHPKRVDFPPREGGIMEALAKAEAPFVRNPSGAIEADHYTPVFAQLNLRDETVRAYWLQCWRHLRENVGLDGIFLDSSFNLSSDKHHYAYNRKSHHHGATPDQEGVIGFRRPAREPAAAILSQFHAHLSLMAAMQRLGYAYCGEDLGVFGVHRTGPGIVLQADNLSLWSDTYGSFDAAALRAAGHDPARIFFRGLAYRFVWMLCWLPKHNVVSWRYGTIRDDDDRPTEAQLRTLKAFTELEPLMRGPRTILPGETGVRYDNADGSAVIWAFAAFDLSLKRKMRVRDVLTERREAAETVCAQPGGIYVCAPVKTRGRRS